LIGPILLLIVVPALQTYVLAWRRPEEPQPGAAPSPPA
jgi:hypothetical protein